MTTGEIEAFIAIYQCGNLSRAARKMNLSQPSLSSKLQLLEEELGCRLFVRYKGVQSIITTKEGEALYPLALQYMELQKKMYSAVKLPHDRVLRICATNSIGSTFLMPAWESYQSRYEGTRIQIQDAETAAAYELLSSGAMDFALSPIIDPYSKVKAIPIVEEPFVLVCSEDAEYSDGIEWEDLKMEDEIYVQWSEEFIQWHRVHLGDLSEINLRVEMMSQLQYFLERGGKWAFVPLSVGKHLLHHERVRQCTMNFSIPNRIISCLYLESNPASRMRNQFIQCLLETMKREYGEEIHLLLQ